ncbi:TerC/Alx family metal homeostasis membrane protein [Demequina salsinemoris]|uniref:TerC/Alx family metal homeostasis membrane protein n=1 Tax=Demequina salsinemoris TaxID=577470 RepID=UPI000A059622|nr:TerC/Alx family metal homeostasis membrane protein [Demequina salsinemoris]
MESPLVWTLTLVGLTVLFVFDFVVVVGKPHVPTFKESTRWYLFYVALALAFGAGLWWLASPDKGTEFLAGYVTEASLSVDNLFVFLVILTRFAVPPRLRERALLIGIALALVFRAVFIFAGAAALAAFHWVFFLFGAFLLYTAFVIAKEGGAEEGEAEYKENAFIRAVRRAMPVTDGYRGNHVIVHEHGARMMTPLLLVIVALGSTDVMFALDSIPAIFGLTQDPYIVFTANAFALLGLRQLFFIVEGLLTRLIYLSYGLATVLGFIGVKMILEALHGNTLPFINDGMPMEQVPVPSTAFSLAFIVVVLGIAAGASMIVSGRSGKHLHDPLEDVEPEPRTGENEQV